MPPMTEGILEPSLYVRDLPRSVRFYQEIFGFSVVREFREGGCAMCALERAVGSLEACSRRFAIAASLMQGEGQAVLEATICI